MRLFFLLLFPIFWVNAQDNLIPQSRLIDWNPGVEKNISDPSVKTELPADDLKSDDASKAIQKAIDSLTVPGIILLPEGEFICRSAINMKSGVFIRGRGISSTRLIFDLGNALPSISFTGRSGKIFKIENDRLPAGSTKIQVSENEGLNSGDNILISADNDGSIMYTSPKWNINWAKRSWGQVLRIKSIDSSTIETDIPLRLDYEKARNPTIQKLEMLENAGLEDIYMKRIDSGDVSMINITRSINCRISNIESEDTTRSHIWIYDSRFITVENSEFHHSRNYGGGGHGYGVTAGTRTCDCLVTNNIFYSLRHSMMTKQSASGNVFSYNYSFERRLPNPLLPGICDISIHGHYSHMNLFEGNIVEFVNCGDYWGPAGPYTTFFRNRVSFLFKAGDSSTKINIIANTISSVLFVDKSCTEPWITANRINGILPDNIKIPPSLYLKEKPSFWGDLPWPCIGADVDKDSASLSPIPAQIRFRMKK